MFTEKELEEFNISNEDFKKLKFDHRMGLIQRLRNHGDLQPGKTDAEHYRKAKQFFNRADELYKISGIWSTNNEQIKRYEAKR